jgi:hypothetical protein
MLPAVVAMLLVFQEQHAAVVHGDTGTVVRQLVRITIYGVRH